MIHTETNLQLEAAALFKYYDLLVGTSLKQINSTFFTLFDEFDYIC